MITSESTENINAALCAFQGDMEAVKKGAANPFFKSKYADLPSIIAAIKPHMRKHGLSTVQGGGMDNGHLVINTRINHTSGEWIETECPIGIAKDDPQGWGSAYTYGRRYSLQAALGLSAEDDDGNAASKRTTAVPVKRTSAKQVPEWVKLCDEVAQGKIKEMGWNTGDCEKVWDNACKSDLVPGEYFLAKIDEAYDEWERMGA